MIDWNLAGSVILSGMVLVFIVLTLLIIIVEFASRLSGSNKNTQSASVLAAPKAAASAKSSAASVASVPTSGVPGEHIAAISAAVAAMMEEESPGVSYTITNIQRTRGNRPVWGFAGMQQNTRPF